MKSTIAFLIIVFISTYTYGLDWKLIVPDDEPNEIYFIGVHPNFYGFGGFYYSSDCGETIELRDSITSNEEEYGTLVPDAANNTLYRLYRNDTLAYIERQLLSTDGGYSWDVVNDTLTNEYASGIISGEIYRSMDWISRIERSDNYGVSYNPCICSGYPDTLTIMSIALGVDSGEVYIWGAWGNLYYSDDHGDSFIYLGDLHTTWGINPWTDIFTGAESGEIYIFHHDPKIIWRVFNFGGSAEIIADFPPIYDFWRGGFTPTSEPGELYFLAVDPGWLPGGTMHIYHTLDYFQTWTFYEHIIPDRIDLKNNGMIPKSIIMDIFPNPANASFNISYELNSVQDVQIQLYNSLGQRVWCYHGGLQNPSNHQISYANEKLSSGTYFLQLYTRQSTTTKAITILK